MGTVKEYTTAFNAAAARTKFSDADKRERYRDGLPPKLKDIFAQGAHTIDTLQEIQKEALALDQNLQLHEDKHRETMGQISTSRKSRRRYSHTGRPCRSHLLPLQQEGPQA